MARTNRDISGKTSNSLSDLDWILGSIFIKSGGVPLGSTLYAGQKEAGFISSGYTKILDNYSPVSARL